MDVHVRYLFRVFFGSHHLPLTFCALIHFPPPAWIVQDVTLFHTIAVFGITGERASMSNGSLASSRVLNMARSPNAIVYVYVKFATTVSYSTIQLFERMLREFIQSRPREWANFTGFRATRVVSDAGFIGKFTNKDLSVHLCMNILENHLYFFHLSSSTLSLLVQSMLYI
jgi:hypothetical protein